jgi:chorismate mutase/prephenate dehydratase
MAHDGDETLSRLRAEIAALDADLVAAINRRIELVRQIRRHKEQTGIAFVDPAQEQANLDRLASANDGPLSASGLEELYRAVLALSKRESG